MKRPSLSVSHDNIHRVANTLACSPTDRYSFLSSPKDYLNDNSISITDVEFVGLKRNEVSEICSAVAVCYVLVGVGVIAAVGGVVFNVAVVWAIAAAQATVYTTTTVIGGGGGGGGGDSPEDDYT